MSEENVSQEFRLKNKDETRNYLIEEINQNELMNKKPKNVYRVVNYFKHLLILISTVTGFKSISAFASLAGVPVGMSSSARLKTCVITAGIKKYKSIIKKNKKMHGKLVLLATFK